MAFGRNTSIFQNQIVNPLEEAVSGAAQEAGVPDFSVQGVQTFTGTQQPGGFTRGAGKPLVQRDPTTNEITAVGQETFGPGEFTETTGLKTAGPGMAPIQPPPSGGDAAFTQQPQTVGTDALKQMFQQGTTLKQLRDQGFNVTDEQWTTATRPDAGEYEPTTPVGSNQADYEQWRENFIQRMQDEFATGTAAAIRQARIQAGLQGQSGSGLENALVMTAINNGQVQMAKTIQGIADKEWAAVQADNMSKPAMGTFFGTLANSSWEMAPTENNPRGGFNSYVNYMNNALSLAGAEPLNQEQINGLWENYQQYHVEGEAAMPEVATTWQPLLDLKGGIGVAVDETTGQPLTQEAWDDYLGSMFTWLNIPGAPASSMPRNPLWTDEEYETYVLDDNDLIPADPEDVGPAGSVLENPIDAGTADSLDFKRVGFFGPAGFTPLKENQWVEFGQNMSMPNGSVVPPGSYQLTRVPVDYEGKTHNVLVLQGDQGTFSIQWLPKLPGYVQSSTWTDGLNAAMEAAGIDTMQSV